MSRTPQPEQARTMAAMVQVLDEARLLGFVGPGSVEGHIEHAEAFARAVERAVQMGGQRPPPQKIVDLGSGGGLPGLVMARRWPLSVLDLLEGRARRASFLVEAVEELALSGRVAVIADRAESVGRSPDRRGHYEVAVARSFGAPAVTAECGAPMLEAGGWLVVSEPPDSERTEGRWSPTGLGVLGMSAASPVEVAGYHFVAVRQLSECPDRFPRRTGIPSKRPIF